MKITVAICTWNRAALLHETLQRMRCLIIPEGVSWEVIVVNNNCTDNTDEVIERHVDSVLPIRRLFVSEQGQCHCRNAAIEAATGDWILWTDDDVLVAPDWLSEYVTAIKANPKDSFMGGSIAPWFETPPPAWLKKHFARLEGAFAVTPVAPETRTLDVTGKDEAIFGANMAFRTEVMREFPFNTELGLVGEQPMRGDETDMVLRLVAAGHEGLWVGSAKVQHYIPTKRMTTKYLWEFFYGCGQAQSRMAEPTQVATWFGQPRWAIRGWLSSMLAAKFLYPLKNRLWLQHFSRAATCAGVLNASKQGRLKETYR